MDRMPIRPVEFSPPLPGENPTFFILAALALLLLPAALRRKDYFFLLGAPACLVLALSGRRFIPFFLILALPGLLDGTVAILEKIRERGISPLLAGAGVVTIAILAGVLLFKDWNRYYRHIKAGAGVNEAILPERACDFIEKQGLSGTMYNDLRFGGFLMWRLWPERPVFQDGRIIPYPPDFLREMHGEKTPLTPHVWRGYMDKYGVEYALVRRDFLGQDQEIVSLLFEESGWPLVYLDGISAVYVRPGSENSERTANSRFYLLGSRQKPLQLYRSGLKDPETMIRELGRVSVDSILLPHDSLRFAAAALGAGDRDLAERFSERWSDRRAFLGTELDLIELEAALGEISGGQ